MKWRESLKNYTNKNPITKTQKKIINVGNTKAFEVNMFCSLKYHTTRAAVISLYRRNFCVILEGNS